MKIHIKHITAIIVLFTMIFSSMLPYSAFGDNTVTVKFDGTQSSWAEPELKEAYELALTYTDVMCNFKKNITREEFCTLVIKLYEKLTEKTASSALNPFKDTNNKEILKAYELGIVKGTSTDTFSPTNNITRQEICVMIFRALKVSISNLSNDSQGDFPFKDTVKIASWALDAMKFAYKNEIMKGISTDTIDPLSNTTREQGIILLLRTYKKFSNIETSDIKATIPVKAGPLPDKNNKIKYEFTMNSNNIFFPKFDERIELFVATKPGKPSSMPSFSSLQLYDKLFPLYASLNIQPITITPIKPGINDQLTRPKLPNLNEIQPPIKERPAGSVYTRSDYGSFIEKSGDKVRWFAFKLKNASGASKIIWQVSKTQFSGFKENWKMENGLISSGEVFINANEFSIDFSKALTSRIQANILNSSIKNEITQKQKTYYVRAVPVDASGNPIGDPGKGIAVLYGEPLPSVNITDESSFELWTTGRTYYGDTSAEFKEEPEHDPKKNGNIVSFSPKDGSSRLFQFHGIDESSSKIIIQVSSEKFNQSNNAAENKSIVYEKEYSLPLSNALPEAKYSSLYPLSILVPFSEFGVKVSELVEDQYINYYVRGMAVKESYQPGRFDVSYSDVVTVSYGFGKPLKLNYPPPKYDKYEKINVSYPIMSIKGYKEVQWADPNYLEHYYIATDPKPTDITCNWKNTKTNEVLTPFYSYMFKYKNLADYEGAIKRVLPINALVYIPTPKEEDKSWYEELFDGIIDFFKDIVNTLNKLYSTIKATYDNLKANLVNFVANLCPIESLRGYFKTALEGLINYGLASLGIPPTLPSFSDLAEMNVEYLAEVALTEAGVPPNEITDEIKDKVSKGIINELDKASKVKDENPVNAAFLKLDPNYLYRPAYIELELENNTDYPTVTGYFDINIQFKLKESGIYATPYDPVSLNLVNDTNQYGYDPNVGIITATEYRNHFLYGLNGYTVNYNYGDEAIYEVFKPVVNQKIPVIPPHTKQTLKVYLEPGGFASSSRYPTSEGPRYEDFYNMYFMNGDKDYTWFEVSSYYPTAEEYLKNIAAKNNTFIFLDPKTDYYYYNGYDEYSYFDGKEIHYMEATGFTEQLQMPVKLGWNK